MEDVLTAPLNPALDSALARLAMRGPEYADGMSNHGPMAAEAMGQLGAEPSAIEHWVEGYLTTKLDTDAPGRGKRLVAGDLPLGVYSRFGDWQATFGAGLAEAPWQEVLSRWWPVLLPGAAAAAAHGLIRTGHAVRALAAADTPARRAELAQGLAYWAARWQPLAGAARIDGPLPLDRALAATPAMRAPDGDRGNISERLARLDTVPGFGTAVGQFGAGPDIGAGLSALTAAAARLQPAHTGCSIALVHALTGPAAARLALPHLPAELQAPTLAAGWQLVAGLSSAYAYQRHPPLAVPAAAPAPAWPQLVERALASGDEHAVKYAEAARREDALAPDPAYRQAVSAYLLATTAG